MEYPVARQVFIGRMTREQIQGIHSKEKALGRHLVGCELSKIIAVTPISAREEVDIKNQLQAAHRIFPWHSNADSFDPMSNQHNIDWYLLGK